MMRNRNNKNRQVFEREGYIIIVNKDKTGIVSRARINLVTNDLDIVPSAIPVGNVQELECLCEKYLCYSDDDLATQNIKIKELERENQELKKQLKNAKLKYKYDLDQEVYIIWNTNIIDVKIKAIVDDTTFNQETHKRLRNHKYYVNTCHFDLSDDYENGGGLLVNENEIFNSFEEAQQKLKEIKGE